MFMAVCCAALAGEAVVSGAAGDGVHEIFTGEDFDGGGEPAIEDGEEAFADEGGVEDAAIEEDVGGLLAPEEGGEVAGDGGVGGVGEAYFLEGGAAGFGGGVGGGG